MNLSPLHYVVGLGVLLLLVPLVVLGDKIRIRRTLEKKGGIYLRAHWRPFRASDMGEDWLRVYDVIYQDPIGRMHVCRARIAFLPGVLLERDRMLDGHGQQSPLTR